tara:strand:- start:223 stop:456 length:234 start_codon:yes stop_codon:yes gene_type:complete
MQKIINVLAIASSVVSLTVVGGGVYLYTQKDAIIEDIKEKALGSLSGGISDALPGLVDTSIPDATGDAMPLPTVPSF